VAPEATQRTPLEKDRGADTRPIVDGEPLDIENNAVCMFFVGHIEPFRRTANEKIGHVVAVSVYHGRKRAPRTLRVI
jgi:hypothetical protein